MVAEVVDVVDTLVLDHRSDPDEVNPVGKAPRSLRLLFYGKFHLD